MSPSLRRRWMRSLTRTVISCRAWAMPVIGCLAPNNPNEALLAAIFSAQFCLNVAFFLGGLVWVWHGLWVGMFCVWALAHWAWWGHRRCRRRRFYPPGCPQN